MYYTHQITQVTLFFLSRCALINYSKCKVFSPLYVRVCYLVNYVFATYFSLSVYFAVLIKVAKSLLAGFYYAQVIVEAYGPIVCFPPQCFVLSHTCTGTYNKISIIQINR